MHILCRPHFYKKKLDVAHKSKKVAHTCSIGYFFVILVHQVKLNESEILLWQLAE